MWKIKFQGIDKIYSERDFKYWDIVLLVQPLDLPIEKITFRVLGTKYVITGADYYCIDRISIGPLGGFPRHLGYIIYSIYGDRVEEIQLAIMGISKKTYDISKLKKSLSKFRKGMGSGFHT
jgi:hypothetical protein